MTTCVLLIIGIERIYFYDYLSQLTLSKYNRLLVTDTTYCTCLCNRYWQGLGQRKRFFKFINFGDCSSCLINYRQNNTFRSLRLHH